MALQDSSGRYFKIKKIVFNDDNTFTLSVECFKNSSIRQNVGEFDKVLTVNTGGVTTDTVSDSIITMLYDELKKIEYTEDINFTTMDDV